MGQRFKPVIQFIHPLIHPSINALWSPSVFQALCSGQVRKLLMDSPTSSIIAYWTANIISIDLGFQMFCWLGLSDKYLFMNSTPPTRVPNFLRSSGSEWGVQQNFPSLVLEKLYIHFITWRKRFLTCQNGESQLSLSGQLTIASFRLRLTNTQHLCLILIHWVIAPCLLQGQKDCISLQKCCPQWNQEGRTMKGTPVHRSCRSQKPSSALKVGEKKKN